MQNEMQKQMASDRSMEKDNSDALEKFLIQQTFKHFLNEELPAIIEKTLKRELAMFVQTVEERFQKVLGNISSKLEAVVARQIQAQSQILQEALKLRLEASVVPEFEKSYSTMLELSIFMAERKYEEAFTTALMMEDVNIVSWLCAQVDLSTILWANCPPLSQVVLLNLLQNLACDISKETPRKLIWMRDVLSHIRRTDPTISELVRPIFEQVFRKLNHQHNLPTSGFSECASIRLIMHVIYSMLTNTISTNELYVHE